MKQLRNMKLFSAAMAAASLLAIPAFGQLRSGQDGHSNDASNRVGSGGYNSPGSVYNTGLSQNNFIYRDVTGLSGFSGPVGERDPGAFTGPVGGNISSNFVRTTAGVPTAYQAPQYSNAPMAYYGSSRAVAPPIGTERIGYTQSYLGTQYTPSDVNTLGSEITSALDVQRQRYGESTVLGVGSKFLDNGSPAAQVDQGGPLDSVTAAGNYLGSPLYGLQGLSGNAASEATDFGLPIFATPSSASVGTQRFRFRSTTTPEVDQMRKELMLNPDDQQNQNGLNPAQNGDQQSLNSLQSNNVANALESPNSKPLSSREANSALNSGNIDGGLNIQEGVKRRMTLMTPQQQSKQYDILSHRLDQMMNSQVRQLQANARINTQIARSRERAANGAGGDTGFGAGATTRPSAPGVGAGPYASPPGTPAPDSGPLKIQSLAEGVNAKGLHDLLLSAEGLMRDGKFSTAIQKYNTAARVAPNNGLIPLGRANAELGAGFYYQASTDLHQVFQHDPALLLGQYDVKSWIGEKRLAYITDELRHLSDADTKQETPAFLLAYISYNTGRESDAEEYLREARSRAGNRDPLLSQLESRWKLSSSSTLQGNK
jgi:hypothetical protein